MKRAYKVVDEKDEANPLKKKLKRVEPDNNTNDAADNTTTPTGLVCEGCHAPTHPPVFSCIKGHAHCGLCVSRRRRRLCRVCRNGMTLNRQLTEKARSATATKNNLFTCPFVASGCQFQTDTMKTLEGHTSFCSFRDVMCNLAEGENHCHLLRVPMEIYGQHLMNHHAREQVRIKLGKSKTIKITVPPGVSQIKNDPNQMFHATCLSKRIEKVIQLDKDDATFLLSAEVPPRGTHEAIKAWISRIGGCNEQIEMYNVQIRVGDCKHDARNAPSQSLNVLPFHDGIALPEESTERVDYDLSDEKNIIYLRVKFDSNEQ